jgi:hypothetical protein
MVHTLVPSLQRSHSVVWSWTMNNLKTRVIVKPQYSIPILLNFFFLASAEAQYKQCNIFQYAVNFDLANNPYLVYNFQNLYSDPMWLCWKQWSTFPFSLYCSGGQLNISRGPNLTYRTPSRARSSVSFRRATREYCPPPHQTVSVTNRGKNNCI